MDCLIGKFSILHRLLIAASHTLMHKRLLLPFLFFTLHSFSQNKPVVYQQQSWMGWYPQVKFSKHWGTWFDSEIHTSDHYFNGFSQAVFRLAATYYNKKGNKFTAGYGYTDYFPGDNHKFISIPEHHAWEQYQWYKNTKKHKLMQWFRMEQKFKENVIDDYTADNSYTLIYRLRHNIYYTLSLSKRGLVPGALSLAIGNELYLYYGPGSANHLFDQDRVFLGFSYALNSHDNFVLGVTNIFQENAAGTSYLNNNVFRVSLFQNIGLKQRD